jgi:hypothetical protein
MELNCHVLLSHITYILSKHNEAKHVYGPVTYAYIFCLFGDLKVFTYSGYNKIGNKFSKQHKHERLCTVV